ncbi:hypothetical protein, partial [Streptomyces nanshensis]|uniref:hypothetical protein n=1 Tax=Streptomyces nanshensis TaxID=518642 RepID=UPI00085C440E
MNPTPAPASVRGAESCVAPLTTTYRRLGALSPNLNLGIAPEDGPTGSAGSAGSTGSAGNSRAAAPAGDDRTGPADDWTDLGELAREPRVLDALLEAEGARCAGNSATGIRPDVVASRMLHRILWATCLLLSGPWYLERRVPRLGPSDVRIGRRDEALQIVVPGGFACLPDDPAASLAGAHVLPDEEALRQELRTAAADQARPLIAALAQRARRGPRALWGMVEDDLVSGIWHLGRATG